MRVVCKEAGHPANQLTVGKTYEARSVDPEGYEVIGDNGKPVYVYKNRFRGAETDDPINRPPWYTSHPSGVECLQITEHMDFCLGNAIKYIWRAGLKSDKAVEDLKKARFYIDREIARLEKGK